MTPINSNLLIQLLRNATVTFSFGGKTFLVDPFFSGKATLDPIPWTNETRNPTVDLPLNETALRSIVDSTDAVILTHLHPDHWDVAAQELIPKNIPLVCQKQDAETLKAQGFTTLHTADNPLISGIEIIRTAAQHGLGELAEKMAPVSGYILKFEHRTVYITGDTVWYSGVKDVINEHQPDIVVVNAGSAQFQFGEPITMNAADVIKVARAIKPTARVVVAHMEAINHCYLKRSELKEQLKKSGLEEKCYVPEDGETIYFPY
jgi:L-ascorbate metabolism protein UlaG (beta-lactamase superfamily)